MIGFEEERQRAAVFADFLLLFLIVFFAGLFIVFLSKEDTARLPRDFCLRLGADFLGDIFFFFALSATIIVFDTDNIVFIKISVGYFKK